MPCSEIYRLCLFIAGIVIVLSIWEQSVSAHSWMAPKKEADIPNPIPASQASIGKGNELFLSFCAHCHGNKAEGMSSKSTGLKSNPPNLFKRLATHTHGDFYWKIRTGKGEMPSFKEELSGDETWAIIRYIESLNK